MLYDATVGVLLGSRCRSCGTAFFPRLDLGCEVCGGTQLEPLAIEPKGVLHSVATVHLYQGHDIEAPFSIGEVQLDAGPLIRATMTQLVEREAIGSRVEAVWTQVGDRVEPWFGVV